MRFLVFTSYILFFHADTSNILNIRFVRPFSLCVGLDVHGSQPFLIERSDRYYSSVNTATTTTPFVLKTQIFQYRPPLNSPSFRGPKPSVDSSENTAASFLGITQRKNNIVDNVELRVGGVSRILKRSTSVLSYIHTAYIRGT